MQRNTPKILEQMNYEEVEPYLLSNFILSFAERKDLAKESSQKQRFYVIEKVTQGTEETFKSFLKALEQCQDDSNHQLMLYLQQAHKEEEMESLLSKSEMQNTPCGSMANELVLGDMSFQPQSSFQCSTSKNESKTFTKYASHSGPSQYDTKIEKPLLSTVSLNHQGPSSPMNITSDPQKKLELSESWVVVQPHTSIPYSKILTLLMEYICDEVMSSLMGSSCVQSTFTQLNNISSSLKLPKEVYLAANPSIPTPATRAADDQIKQAYKELLKILHRLHNPSYPRVNINLDTIIKRINYSRSSNHITLIECDIENLIQAVNKLNQPTIHKSCTIL